MNFLHFLRKFVAVTGSEEIKFYSWLRSHRRCSCLELSDTIFMYYTMLLPHRLKSFVYDQIFPLFFFPAQNYQKFSDLYVTEAFSKCKVVQELRVQCYIMWVIIGFMEVEKQAYC